MLLYHSDISQTKLKPSSFSQRDTPLVTKEEGVFVSGVSDNPLEYFSTSITLPQDLRPLPPNDCNSQVPESAEFLSYLYCSGFLCIQPRSSTQMYGELMSVTYTSMVAQERGFS